MLTNRYGLGIVLFIAVAPVMAADVRVEGVRIGSQANKTRVAIDLSHFAGPIVRTGPSGLSWI